MSAPADRSRNEVSLLPGVSSYVPRKTLNTTLFWASAFAILLIAVGLRIPSLATRSLWLDEAYSAWFSARPLQELWTKVPQYETHPPLYYTLLKGWRGMFGASEDALRSLSVLVSVLTVLLLSISGRLLRVGRDGEVVSLLAGLFLAANAGSIKYAQEARPYALETLAVTATLLAAAGILTAARSQDVFRKTPTTALAVILSLSGGLVLWCHNTAVFVLFGVWCALFISILLLEPALRLRALAVAIVAGIGALAVWAPFLPWFIHQSQSFSAMQFWISSSPHDLVTAWILAGGGLPPAFIVCPLAIGGAWALWRRDRPLTALLSITLMLPLCLVLAVSFTVKPIYIDRLFSWMAPPLMVFVACCVVAVTTSVPVRAVICAILLASSLQVVIAGYAEEPMDNFRALSREIMAQAKPGDAVIVVPNELSVGFEYYAGVPDFPPVTYVPGPFPYLSPAGGRRYVANLGAPAIELADIDGLERKLGNPGRIWLVTRGIGIYDPDGSVRRVVASRGTLVAEFHFGIIEASLYESRTR